jgi:peptide/nickel transport system ATP-binding protein
LRQLEEIQAKLGMSMIYISHDIAVIAEVSDRIGVMYAGQMVEMASAIEIFKKPLHPYTYALMNSFPSIKGKKQELKPLPGEPPDLINPPKGCRFHPRCARATEICMQEMPAFEDYGNNHFAACWHPLEEIGNSSMSLSQ